ncbi:MAG: hypothetical protein QOH95_1044 [Gaiellaceae bacterium]|nr:hypothetical protein [Gaiellaceae bacterium]
MTRIVDLTHALWDEVTVHSGQPPAAVGAVPRVVHDDPALTEYHVLNHMGAHLDGTHIDAPVLQGTGSATLDDVPLERLVADAVTIDVSDLAPGPIARTTLEPRASEARPGDWVFLYSDNGRNYGTADYWTGWAFPDAGAASMLIDRGITGVGFDGPSCEPVDTTSFDLHRVWLGAGRLILENLTNLGELPSRTPVVVAPMKVREAHGGPSRVFAFVADQSKAS